MSTRSEYPAGVPCWVETLQPDPRAALDFYGPLLCWELSEPGPMPGGLPGEYVVARVDGLAVAGIGALPDVGQPPFAVWNTYVRVDGVDAAVDRATTAGATLLLGPVDAAGGGRLAVLADPAGAAFCVGDARGRPGAERVNEPGAWAMSSLHTPDPTGASAFYGTLFGWRSEPIAPGAPVTLLRLAGHVGGEPGQPFPRDVVAVMTSTEQGPAAPAVPPHWNVNLRVGDADAVAAHAAQLGGSVLVAPMDAMGLRNAVLLDPQGAAFSISS
jgi:predicted enzyme related to lactoylglutathione lyase